MRQDKHKAQESLKYQKKKKNEGDTTAADVAAARRRSAAARDKGVGVAAIRRRNGEMEAASLEEQERRQQQKATFARRKVTSNQDRYVERTEEDELADDADLGIDRLTTNLVAMLKETDDASGANYFKFKEEQLFDTKQTFQDGAQPSMLQINFDAFEEVIQQTDTRQLLGLSDRDTNLIEYALENMPAQLDKPIVPSFATNVRGLVMFNTPMVVEPSKTDGIFVRNNPVKPAATKKDTTEDELDALLALDAKQQDAKGTMTSTTPLSSPSRGRALPQPGSNHARPGQKTDVDDTDDQAWLDQMLG